jgi:hypothetical protein
MKYMSVQIIILPDHTAYLPGAEAAITFSPSSQIFSTSDLKLIPFNKNGKEYRGIVPWGDDPEKRKVVQLNHKEACFSRWDSMNPTTGQVEFHFYSAKWNEQHTETDLWENICQNSYLDLALHLL